MYTVKVKIRESKIEGKGYIADEDIAIGTIVYYYNDKDKKYTKEEYERLTDSKKEHLQNFAVENEFGGWVLTNTGPYTNHSCDANILPIFIDGIYIDLAVKNIKKGDEITIDYRLFYSSTKWEMKCNCKSSNCSEKIGFGISIPQETERLWEERLEKAMKKIYEVKQAIFTLKDKGARVITKSVKEKKPLTLGKFVKFCLISSK